MLLLLLLLLRKMASALGLGHPLLLLLPELLQEHFQRGLSDGADVGVHARFVVVILVVVFVLVAVQGVPTEFYTGN